MYEKSAPSKVDSGAEARHIQEPSLETPASAVEMPPWAESYGFSADAEGEHLYGTRFVVPTLDLFRTPLGG